MYLKYKLLFINCIVLILEFEFNSININRMAQSGADCVIPNKIQFCINVTDLV